MLPQGETSGARGMCHGHTNKPGATKLKRLLALLFAALCAMAAQANDLTPEQRAHNELLMAVYGGTAVADHHVTLEGYDFAIYVDRSVSPPVVVTQQTLAALDKLFKIKSQPKQSAMMRQLRWLSTNYARSLRGETPLPPVESNTEDADDPEPEAVEMIHSCPENFPGDDVGENHVNGHKVTIDKVGRPSKANIKLMGAPTAARRYEDCQKKTGKMGGRGSADHGGHHIGSRLGGWGKRANMTPQNGALNLSGEWKEIDATIEFCAVQGFEPDQTLTIEYYKSDDPEDLRPIIYADELVLTLPTCPPQPAPSKMRVANETPDIGAKATMRNFTMGAKVLCATQTLGGGCQ